MSDEKQPRSKRTAPAPQIAAHPINPAPKAASIVAAPPKPEAKPAAPVARTAAEPVKPAPKAVPVVAASPEPEAKPALSAPQAVVEPTEPAAETAPAAMALPEPEVKPALPVPLPQPRGADRYYTAYRATLASVGESQAAVASNMMAMALEMSGLARSSLTIAGDSVSALLTARSLVDAIEAQLGFARRSIDAMAGGSTRLGEIGLRLANDAAKPVLRPVVIA